MRLFRATGALMRLSVLLTTLVALCAARDEPKITSKQFKYSPTDIHYFEDSDVVLVTVLEERSMWQSTDGGATWEVPKDIGDEPGIVQVFTHPNDNKVAVALGNKRHWITQDQGKSWRHFETKFQPVDLSPLRFHATDSSKMILNTINGDQEAARLETLSFYTTNSFKDTRILRKDSIRCAWAKEKAIFETEDKAADATRALCIVPGKSSSRTEANRLVISDNYFDTEHSPDDETQRPFVGVISMAHVTKYILVGQMSDHSRELNMFVTGDTDTWHRAEFIGQKLESDSFTVMESTNYSIQADIMPESRSRSADSYVGMLYSSNSNGTYFRRSDVYTNHNTMGYADYEKITNIQGVALLNAVENAKDILEGKAREKVIVSKITFDDGRTFQNIKAGKDDLHLHSVTEFRNFGRVFSSAAPGLAMGVGNTGKSLMKYNDGDLYVSDTGGESWYLALEGAHKYEFGDQGSILLAVYDEAPTKRVMYSLGHGKRDTWKTLDVDKDAFKPVRLTTVPDSTSRKFLLQATIGRGGNTKHVIYSIDFEPLDLPKCKESDFESWYARVDPETKRPGCIMGHTQAFRRRKADAACFVHDDFHEQLPENDSEECPCTDADYECAYNFVRSEDRKDCVPTDALRPPKGACKSDDDTYESPSGWQLIPGNTCNVDKGVKKEKPTTRKCNATGKEPEHSDGKVRVTYTPFGVKHDAVDFREYYYLERGENSPETVLMTTDDDRRLYISQDHGKKWAPPKEHGIEDEVLAIFPNRHEHDHVYFITNTEKIWFSKNRGEKMDRFTAPAIPARGTIPLHFHPTHPEWLIFIGCAEMSKNRDCVKQSAFYSTNQGEDWKVLVSHVDSCDFVYTTDRRVNEKLVYCNAFEDADPTKRKFLFSTADWFEHHEILFKDIVNFAVMSEFIIVAKKDDESGKYLNLMTSMDGKTFAEAKFPHDLQIAHETAYTVLGSSTGAIFVHVTMNNNLEQEYGSILKSNSNGTYFVKSLDFVNRNMVGYVDFEKVLGLEGASIANVVSNVQEVDKGSLKKVKTVMSHNDGADWAPIAPPKQDSENKPYACQGDGIEKCSLNLHAFTSRRDFRDTLSSPSATGMIFGVGNVGDRLKSKKDCDTFISSDGGVTWREVMKGQYQWEFGDQGSVIVIVSEREPTNKFYYSRQEGKDGSWKEVEFSEKKVVVKDITTTPADGSLNFLLWTKADGKPTTYNIDFKPIVNGQCKVDDDPEKSDYYLWTPEHPNQNSDCLFGHQAEYYRRKVDRDCYNGPPRVEGSFKGFLKNCTCTNFDFECAYNYERQPDGSCKLLAGLEPKDPMAVCEAGANEYMTGIKYRKIPHNTCEGGKELDLLGEWKPCPGKEKEFRKKHPGMSGAGLFFAIVIPVLAAGGIGYFAWKQYEGKFGRIRLGETRSPSFDTNSPWIAWPVTALSAVAAALLAIPTVVSSLVRTIGERFGRGHGSRGGYRSARPYTSRHSFARGRGNYSAVGNDESDLLGEDDSEDDM